jgi:hypothetical protein
MQSLAWILWTFCRKSPIRMHLNMDKEPVPSSFYQMSSLRGDERKAWVRDTLVKGLVYFRRRDELNDPAELRPRLTFKGRARDLRNYVRGLVERYGANLNCLERINLANQLKSIYREEGESLERSFHDTLDGIGIFCLTEAIDSTVMWGHYADGHRGIAFEFDPEVGLFVAAQKVIYSNKEPVINRLEDAWSELFTKSILMKWACWDYEKEWRVMARHADAEADRELFKGRELPSDFEAFIRNQHGPGHYSIPPRAIKSVILGSRISRDDEDWVRATVAEMPTPVKIRRARFVNGIIVVED